MQGRAGGNPALRAGYQVKEPLSPDLCELKEPAGRQHASEGCIATSLWGLVFVMVCFMALDSQLLWPRKLGKRATRTEKERCSQPSRARRPGHTTGQPAAPLEAAETGASQQMPAQPHDDLASRDNPSSPRSLTSSRLLPYKGMCPLLP